MCIWNNECCLIKHLTFMINNAIIAYYFRWYAPLSDECGELVLKLYDPLYFNKILIILAFSIH